MGKIWKSKNITDELKLKVLRTWVFSVALRACETWTLKIDRNRLRAFEMYCYRRMLRISWTAKERNENIRRKLRIKDTLRGRSRERSQYYYAPTTILLHNIIQTIAKRKLRLFGHIQRMDSSRKLKSSSSRFGGRDKCTRKTVKNMVG